MTTSLNADALPFEVQAGVCNSNLTSITTNFAEQQQATAINSAPRSLTQEPFHS